MFLQKKFFFPASNLLLVAVVAGLWLARGNAASIKLFESPLTYSMVAQPFASPLAVQTSGANLLKNGGMEPPYYWAYPNHFVAHDWIRWWIHLTILPEYDLTRIQRPHLEGEQAQVYFKWGATYTAGLYQVVTGLTPCTPYRFTMWARNHSLPGVKPHARIGLDPQGTQLTDGPNEGAVLALPSSTLWSSEQMALGVWEELAVEAEPVGDRLTAILYAAPEYRPEGGMHYFDTFWDAGTLSSTVYPDNRLPIPQSSVPSGFITNVITSTVLDSLIIEWDTPEPASTQVWYKFITATVPVTPTGPFTVYLPLVIQQGPPNYPLATAVDTTPVAHHRVVIRGLREDDRIEFIALSRRPLTNTCTTEVSAPFQATMGPIPPILRVYLPLVMKQQ